MKRVFLTGSTGFLGQYLKSELRKRGYTVFTDGSHLDLTNPGDCKSALFRHRPYQYIIHAAGVNGGLSWNLKHPATAFLDNTVMGLNIINTARSLAQGNGSQLKLVSVVASCAYPSDLTVLEEENFLMGQPHRSVDGHAYAKRNLQIASELANREFGLRAVCVCPTTIYGPGMAYGENAKVMGAIMAKVKRALNGTGPTPVPMLGDGNDLRDFIYVLDAAELICFAMENYEDSTRPLNLAMGHEVSIRQLAELIAKVSGYKGGFTWEEKSVAQKRKKMSTKNLFRFLLEKNACMVDRNFEKAVAHTWECYWSIKDDPN